MPIDPRIRQRRVEVQRSLGRRRLRIVVTLASVAVLLVTVVVALHSPLVAVRRVSVTGTHRLTRAEVLRAAELEVGQPMIDVASGTARRDLEALPWVATASVRRSWPSSIEVGIVERTPVGQLPTGPSPTGAVAVVDATGRVLEDHPAPLAGLPVLLGLGAAGAVGAWVPGSPGAGHRLGSAPTVPASGAAELAAVASGGGRAAAIAGALAVSAALVSAHVAVTRIEVNGDGTLSAVVAAGATTVLFGEPTALASKVASLVTVLHALGPQGASSIDLDVPDRPAVVAATAPPPSG